MMNERKRLRFAVICSSNQNRSMEAHNVLQKKGFLVRSFGSGNQVKLPGPSIDKPNAYDFGTPYDKMYNDLLNKDKQLYFYTIDFDLVDSNSNSHLSQIQGIKLHPERFQDCFDRFDVLFTCEERVYDQVIEELAGRIPVDNEPVHVINIDIQDNHEEATIGAFIISDIGASLSQSTDLDNDIDEMLQDCESKAQRPLLHSIAFQ